MPQLRARGLRVEILDGDAVRPRLAAVRRCSRYNRAINIRRIGWVVELLARNGVLVLVSSIAPFRDIRDIRDIRDEVRGTHEANGTAFQVVHVSTGSWSWRGAARRQGVYARQREA